MERLAILSFLTSREVSAQEIFMGYPMGGGIGVQWDRSRKSSWEKFRQTASEWEEERPFPGVW